MNTSTTQTVRTLTAALGRLARTGNAETICTEIVHKIQIGDLEHGFYATAYGTLWALKTGRLPGAVASRIERQLTAKAVIALLAQARGEVETMGEMPSWLIANA